MLNPARRASAQGAASWTYTGDLNTKRRFHTATLLQNRKVLVAGGLDDNPLHTIPLNSTELYDPATGTWGFTGNLNTGRTHQVFLNAGVTPSVTDRTAAINEFGSATFTTDTGARDLRRVAENSAFAQQEFNRAFVLMQYFGYLRRNPNDPPEPMLDFQGYNFWLNKLNSFNGNFVNAEMVKAFISSSEYRRRF